MFYSQYVLTKKGPLAKIWLAAHMQSKLTKAMVFATDVRKAVDKIMRPEAPMALRLTSNLLLGVARILSRKAKYLLQESSEALTKMKLTFRLAPSTALDLPPEDNNAAYNAITLDSAQSAPLLDLDLLPRRSVDRSHTSSYLAAERDITIDEFAGGLSGGISDAFALEPEMARADDDLRLSLDEPLLFTPSQRTPARSSQSPAIASVLSAPVRDSLASVELARADSPQAPDTPILAVDTPEQLRADTPTRDIAVTPQLDTTTDAPPVDDDIVMEDTPPPAADDDAPPASQPDTDEVPLATPLSARLSTGGELELDDSTPRPIARPDAPTPMPTQDPAATQDAMPSTRGRKRRALARIDDEKTEMTAAEFRACLNDTSDIIRRPRARRRVLPSVANAGHILARPAVAVPAEMAALYTEWFAADAMMHRVSSPLSEGEMRDRSASGERSGEQTAGEQGDAEEPVAATPAERRSMSAAPEPSPGEFLPPQLEMLEPDTSMFETPAPAIADVEAPQRALDKVPPPPSFDDVPPTPAHAEPPVEAAPMDDKLTLRAVALTRVEVTAEDDEETLSKRALAMQQLITSSSQTGIYNLSEALRNEADTTRRTAARTFYETLNLCSRGLVKLEQAQAYGDIIVRFT